MLIIIVALCALLIIISILSFKHYITALALLRYMQVKGYKLPQKGEVTICTKFVIKNLPGFFKK